ncbi:MAG: hypothetical protein ACYS22_12115 [Planctomycetota bacterium]|jgi:hypothetical protein
MRRAFKAALGFALFGLLVLGSPDLAEACPTCQDSLVGQSGGDLGEGFYWSILLMIGVPFSLLGGVIAWLVYITKRQPQGESFDSPGTPPQASHV